MAPDPALHDQIYAALKVDLRSGVILPGQHIDLQRFSDRHRASVTPVREAVCRLIGEGLVQFQRYGGFRLIPLEEDELREAYYLNAMLIAAAIRSASDDSLRKAIGTMILPSESATARQMADCAAAMFAGIADASGHFGIANIVDRISDRIAVARILESEVLKDVRREYLMLTHGPIGELRRTLARRLAHYHRRRVNHASALVGRLQGIILLSR